jgi:small-conductance mechanosensitive channel
VSWLAGVIVAAVSGVDSALLLTVITGLGLLGGIGLGVKAVIERRNLSASAKATHSKAGTDDATAASIVAAAARELIDPLRAELAKERAEHADEVEEERKKVARVRSELDAALRDVETLRATLRKALKEREESEERVRELQLELFRLQEFILLNPGTPPPEV